MIRFFLQSSARIYNEHDIESDGEDEDNDEDPLKDLGDEAAPTAEQGAAEDIVTLRRWGPRRSQHRVGDDPAQAAGPPLAEQQAAQRRCHLAASWNQNRRQQTEPNLT